MSNVSKLDRIVWDEFFASLSQFSDEFEEKSSGFSDQPQAVFQYDPNIIGKDVDSVAKSRRGQALFRRMVLASYDHKCAISDISHASLLVASHIDPWALNAEERLNPSNGICLCNLLDAAFERGLIVFGDQYEVLLSDSLSQKDSSKIRAISSPAIRLPSRFMPDANLIRAHREKFKGRYSPL